MNLEQAYDIAREDSKDSPVTHLVVREASGFAPKSLRFYSQSGTVVLPQEVFNNIVCTYYNGVRSVWPSHRMPEFKY
jgi:hypothetical protein